MTKNEIEKARIEKLMDDNDRRLVEAERMDWHVERAYRLRRRIALASQLYKVTHSA